MRKTIVYFLIITFLCANTSIGQLFKIPNLLEHYTEHTQNIEISFTGFLKLHYLKSLKKHQKEHQKEHHNLPFKTYENNTIVLYSILFTKFQFEIIKTFIVSENNFFYTNCFRSSLQASIWLPPKIVNF